MKKIIRSFILAGIFSIFCVVSVNAMSLMDAMNAHKTEIITMCRDYGVWPSQLIGQAGIESGIYELTQLASVHNNYWGLTYSSQIASKIPTGSCYGGFCSFPTFMDGVKAYCLWWWQSYYGGVQGVLYSLGSTPDQMYSSIIASGFMEQKNGYIEGMYAAISALDANEWDRLAYPDGRKYVPQVEGMSCTHEAVGEWDYPIDFYNSRYSREEVIEYLTKTAIVNAVNNVGQTDNVRKVKYAIYGEESKKDEINMTTTNAILLSNVTSPEAFLEVQRAINVKDEVGESDREIIADSRIYLSKNEQEVKETQVEREKNPLKFTKEYKNNNKTTTKNKKV